MPDLLDPGVFPFEQSSFYERMRRELSSVFGVPSRLLFGTQPTTATEQRALQDYHNGLLQHQHEALEELNSELDAVRAAWVSETREMQSGLAVIGAFESSSYDFAMVPNWDGRGASPLTYTVIALADRLALAYSSAECLIEVRPENDGALSLVWQDEYGSYAHLTVGPYDKVRFWCAPAGKQGWKTAGATSDLRITESLYRGLAFTRPATNPHYNYMEPTYNIHVGLNGVANGYCGAGGAGGGGSSHAVYEPHPVEPGYDHYHEWGSGGGGRGR